MKALQGFRVQEVPAVTAALNALKDRTGSEGDFATHGGQLGSFEHVCWF